MVVAGKKLIQREQAFGGSDLSDKGMIENDKVVFFRKVKNRSELEAMQRPGAPLDFNFGMLRAKLPERGCQRIDRAAMAPGDSPQMKVWHWMLTFLDLPKIV
jgi:hypothetical protein